MMLFGISAIGLVGAPLFLITLLLAAILVFEVVMFINAAQNRNLSGERRILWLVGMLLIHPFVAIIYYFTDRKV